MPTSSTSIAGVSIGGSSTGTSYAPVAQTGALKEKIILLHALVREPVTDTQSFKDSGQPLAGTTTSMSSSEWSSVNTPYGNALETSPWGLHDPVSNSASAKLAIVTPSFNPYAVPLDANCVLITWEKRQAWNFDVTWSWHSGLIFGDTPPAGQIYGVRIRGIQNPDLSTDPDNVMVELGLWSQATMLPISVESFPINIVYLESVTLKIKIIPQASGTNTVQVSFRDNVIERDLGASIDNYFNSFMVYSEAQGGIDYNDEILGLTSFRCFREYPVWLSSGTYSRSFGGNHVVYQPRITGGFNTSQDMFTSGSLSAEAKFTVSEITLNNCDGWLDRIVNGEWSAQPIEIFYGSKSDDFETFLRLYKGIVEQTVFNRESITLRIRDNKSRFKTGIQSRFFTGSGFDVEGIAAMKGLPKPVCLGSVSNVTPVLIDPLGNIYAVHYGTIQNITAVYFGGLAATEGVGNDYLYTPGDAFFELLTIPPANFSLTCDVEGHAGDGFIETPGDLLRYCALEAGLSANEIDQGALDLLPVTPLGIYITEATPIRDVMSAITESFGGYWVIGPDNVLSAGVLERSHIATGAVLESQVMEISKIAAPSPVSSLTINYRRNYTKMSETNIAGALKSTGSGFEDEDLYTYLLSDSDSITELDPGVRDMYELSRMVTIKSLMQIDADVVTEGKRLIELYSRRMAVYEVLTATIDNDLKLGQTVRLKTDRFDLDADRVFTLVGVRLDTHIHSMTLSLWGDVEAQSPLAASTLLSLGAEGWPVYNYASGTAYNALGSDVWSPSRVGRNVETTFPRSADRSYVRLVGPANKLDSHAKRITTGNYVLTIDYAVESDPSNNTLSLFKIIFDGGIGGWRELNVFGDGIQLQQMQLANVLSFPSYLPSRRGRHRLRVQSLGLDVKFYLDDVKIGELTFSPVGTSSYLGFILTRGSMPEDLVRVYSIELTE
jgi:hypothetical protein